MVQTTDRKKEVKEGSSNNAMAHQRDKDRENVRGVFKFYEVPGGKLEFVYRMYKHDPVEKFELFDGAVYTLPLGVAKHLNKSGWYPVHVHTQDEAGKPSMKIGTKVRRYGFQSLEFVDVDDLSEIGKPIISVEFSH